MQELFGVPAPGGGFLGDANTPGTNDLSDFFLPAGASVQGTTLYLVGGNTNDQLNVTPIGAANDGSTGIQVTGKLNNVNINQTFTGISQINVIGFDGNDNFRFAPSLTIPTAVSDGGGNDQIQLDNGNGDSVTIYGNGNDQIKLGDGNGDSATINGNGNNQIEAGNGTGDAVIINGNGNEDVKTGNGSGTVIVAGTGHKNIHLGSDGWSESDVVAA